MSLLVLPRWLHSKCLLKNKKKKRDKGHKQQTYGSDTCHIWDSAGADEQGAGWSVTSRRPEDTTQRLLTDKSQDESKRGDRARLVSHQDQRQKLRENQRSGVLSMEAR